MSSTGRGSKRAPRDFYRTPAWCVRRLLEKLRLPGGLWVETGAIIRAVNEVWDDVRWLAVELEPQPGLRESLGRRDRLVVGDFLTKDAGALGTPRRGAEVVFGNPPFKHAEEFAHHALQLADHVGLLLRLNFLGRAGSCGARTGAASARTRSLR